MKKGVSSVKMSLVRGAALCLTLAVLMAPRQAAAFYPLGGYDVNGQLRYATWPLPKIDTNGDGDVQPDEGLPLMFESGTWGFTDAEIDEVLEGYQQWNGVTTSYMAFQFGDKTPDPLELLQGTAEGSVDFINYVAFDFNPSDFPGSPDASIVPQGSLTLTLMTYVIDDTTVTFEGRTYDIPGGQMVDVDTAINALFYRGEDTTIAQYASLLGDATIAGGYTLGLGPSPLTNVSHLLAAPDDPETIIGITEDRVVSLPDPNGVYRMVGTTPSMVPHLLVVYDDTLTDSVGDLAPDDIAGVSFLYPRASQAIFAGIKQEARTRTSPGSPTTALEGAHVIAWCDVDNDPSTLPVPFSDTLTGLYELNEFSRGLFDLKNLFKQLQTEDGVLFEPTYILSCSPFEVVGDPTLSDFDSTHGGPFQPTGGGLTFATLFSSEVFNESGNLFGLDSVPAGTPLIFEAARNRFVSADSAKTIPQMLPGNTPMFGSGETVTFCPILNAAGNGMGAMAGIQALRGFRDDVLLKSAPGILVADVYYRTASMVSGFMQAHGWAKAIVRAAFYTFVWFLGHPYGLLLLLLGPAGLWVARRRARLNRAAVAATVAVIVLLAAAPAFAQELPITNKQLVGWSEDIVSGKVAAVDCHWGDKRRIVTDVTVSVDDTLKGRLNKGGQVTFQVLGGRVGSVVTYSPQLPRFVSGEDVVVFLKTQKDGLKTVVAGRRGKYLVETDATTKQRYVVKPSTIPEPDPLVNRAPRAASGRFEQKDSSVVPGQEKDKVQTPTAPGLKAVPYDPAKGDSVKVTLDDYKAEIRRIVQEEQASSAPKYQK